MSQPVSTDRFVNNSMISPWVYTVFYLSILLYNIRWFSFSFHVGSGCYDAKAFRNAVKDARYVFDLAGQFGYDMTILDVGGGFPGTENAKITIHEVGDLYPYH